MKYIHTFKNFLNEGKKSITIKKLSDPTEQLDEDLQKMANDIESLIESINNEFYSKKFRRTCLADVLNLSELLQSKIEGKTFKKSKPVMADDFRGFSNDDLEERFEDAADSIDVRIQPMLAIESMDIKQECLTLMEQFIDKWDIMIEKEDKKN